MSQGAQRSNRAGPKPPSPKSRSKRGQHTGSNSPQSRSPTRVEEPFIAFPEETISRSWADMMDDDDPLPPMPPMRDTSPPLPAKSKAQKADKAPARDPKRTSSAPGSSSSARNASELSSWRQQPAPTKRPTPGRVQKKQSNTPSPPAPPPAKQQAPPQPRSSSAGRAPLGIPAPPPPRRGACGIPPPPALPSSAAIPIPQLAARPPPAPPSSSLNTAVSALFESHSLIGSSCGSDNAAASWRSEGSDLLSALTTRLTQNRPRNSSVSSQELSPRSDTDDMPSLQAVKAAHFRAFRALVRDGAAIGDSPQVRRSGSGTEDQEPDKEVEYWSGRQDMMEAIDDYFQKGLKGKGFDRWVGFTGRVKQLRNGGTGMITKSFLRGLRQLSDDKHKCRSAQRDAEVQLKRRYLAQTLHFLKVNKRTVERAKMMPVLSDMLKAKRYP
eukprot:TRINITY_DN21551_c0_g1_i1.p1 TRINITY_DN21551_c0_g1~~TRINITY_DN21551_c0_g1_i1.p1  ORF type:complete len:440 (-),score=70.14 TRINITY_DN21551_c0_g1_i1:242-1561(-)